MIITVSILLIMRSFISSSKSMFLAGRHVRWNGIQHTTKFATSTSLSMAGKISDSLLAEILGNSTASSTLSSTPIIKESGSKAKGFKSPIPKRSKNLLIIGLGNPGDDYDSTRHNIGFRVLDEFAASKKVSMKFTSKFNADYAAIRIGDKNIGLLKPGTYINNSGGPIKKIMENFKLTAKDILIIADDIALDCGNLRLREKGSHGGHNGHRGNHFLIVFPSASHILMGYYGRKKGI